MIESTSTLVALTSPDRVLDFLLYPVGFFLLPPVLLGVCTDGGRIVARLNIPWHLQLLPKPYREWSQVVRMPGFRALDKQRAP